MYFAFKRELIAFSLILFWSAANIEANPDASEQHSFLVSNIGSERATQGNGNKIVTFGDKTHIVWQDSIDEGYFARVRTLDRKTGSAPQPAAKSIRTN